MGSLAYAVGGGLAGGGAGLAAVGAEATHAIVQEGLERLRQQHAESMQANQQQFQAGEAEKTRGFEKGLKEEELTAHGAIAAAQMKQKGELAGEHEKGATERARIAGESRVDAAAIRGYSNNKTGQGVKPFQSQKAGDWIDPANHSLGTVQHDVTFDPNSGTFYAQVGDRTYLADSRGNPVDRFGNQIDPTATRRAPAKAVANLLAHPETAPQFHEAYSYFPTGYLEKLQRGRLDSGSSSSSRSFSLPSGRVFNAPAGFNGGGGAGPAEPPDQQEGPYKDTDAE